MAQKKGLSIIEDIGKEKKKVGVTFKNIRGKYGMFLVLIIVCIVLAILNPQFLSGRNVVNVIRQISLTGIVAIGMTFVILQGDIDLSVGSIAALGGVIASGLSVEGVPVVLAMLIALIVCTVLGLIMGVIVVKANVHAFVVSLGMLSIARGLAMLYTDGKPISNLSEEFCFLGGGTVLGAPMPIIVFVVLMLIAWVILGKTPFGKYVYSIGGNIEATKLSGINVDICRIANFALCSFCACLSGIILAGRVSSGQPAAAEGWELDAIAAVVIGGTSMSGGRGNIIGTLIGALFMGVLRNGLNLMQVSTFYQQIFIGVLIIVAVVVDSLKKDK